MAQGRGYALRDFSGQHVYDQVVQDATPKVIDPESIVLGK
jgi:hypothetical protein